MKTFFLLFLFSFSAWAKDTEFTTVFYDDAGTVYAGIKKTDKKTSPEIVRAQVVHFPFPKGEIVNLKMPQNVESHDVLGILPDREKLFIISHQSEEKIGGPTIHLYNTKKKSWKRIGKVVCPTVTKAKLATTNVVFFCESTGKKGKIRVTPKVLRLGKDRLYRSGYIRIPEFLLRYKKATLLLEGDAPHWKKLRIKNMGDKDVLYRADNLYKEN